MKARTRRDRQQRFMCYLKLHRLKLGLTQREVAKRARIAQNTYCDYEKGYRRPLPRIHVKLAAALECPIDEFTKKLYESE